MVSVKANKDGDIRRFVLPDGANYQQVHEQLASVYSLSHFTIKYKDDEGDLVTISSTDELSEATALTSGNRVLRVHIFPIGAQFSAHHEAQPMQNTDVSTTNAPTTTPAESIISVPSPIVPMQSILASVPLERTPHSQPTVPQLRQSGAEPTPQNRTWPPIPEFSTAAGNSEAGPSSRPSSSGGSFIPEHLREWLSNMFSGMFNSGVFPDMSDIVRGMRDTRGNSEGRVNVDGERARGRNTEWEGRWNDWLRAFNLSEQDIGNFLRDFNLHSLGGEFRNISQGTMEAFRVLMTSLMRSPGAMTLISAIPIALPAMRAFVSELQAGVPVTPERIDALAAALSIALSGPLGADNARRIADLARTAARDETVLALLRRVSNVGATWAGNAANAANAARNVGNIGNDAVRRVERAMVTMGRLDVHENVRCCACSCTPIVGVRFICQNELGQDLCAVCFANDSVSKEGRTYRSIEYPWEVEPGRALVPHPVLAFASTGCEVMFLQKLLTDLGYLNASDYRIRVGIYGPRTADAVNRLRSDCGLRTHGTYGMYDEIAAASLLSVIEARVPPGSASG